MGDTELRDKLINAGKLRAAQFDWGGTTECYLEAPGSALAS